MTAAVISHRGASRKRAPLRGWTARRIMAAVLTLAALTAIALVAPHLRPPATKTADDQQRPARAATTIPTLAPPATPQVEAPPAAASRASVRPSRGRNAGVPLDAAVAIPGEDFEVLSASELAAISQAHE